MKRQLLFLLLFSLHVSYFVHAQSPFTWIESAGGTGSDIGRSMVADGSGNLIVAGSFASPTITFGTTTLSNSSSYSDMFLVKYDALKNVLWAETAGGTFNQTCQGITADVNGDIYVTGSFGTFIDFGLTTLTSTTNGYEDLFIAKYDANGNFLWAHQIGGNQDESGSDITSDINGNIYLTGYFTSPTVTIGSTVLTNVSNGIQSDVFVVKYDGNGNVIWAKSAGGTGEDRVNKLGVDANGNVSVTGIFFSTSITFGSTTLTNPNSNTDFFLVQYDTNGNLLWAKGGSGSRFDQPGGLTVDGSGNIYISGYYDSPVLNIGSTVLTNTDNTGNTCDIFYARFSSTGTLAWAKTIGGNGDDYAYDMTSDSYGYTYIIGTFSSATLSVGFSVLNNINPPQDDILLFKCSFNGIPAWAINYGGTGDDSGFEVAVDGGGEIYNCDFFSSPVIYFDSSYVSNNGATDILLTELSSVMGITESFSKNPISISPNPNNGIFTLDNSSGQISELEIFNSFGQEIYRKENLTEQFAEIDISDQARGIYFIKVISDGKIYSTRMVMQ